MIFEGNCQDSDRRAGSSTGPISAVDTLLQRICISLVLGIATKLRLVSAQNIFLSLIFKVRFQILVYIWLAGIFVGNRNVRKNTLFPDDFGGRTSSLWRDFRIGTGVLLNTAVSGRTSRSMLWRAVKGMATSSATASAQGVGVPFV